MFDIGFSELVVCLVVALIVLGPEKLPRVARTLGRWSGQAKGYLRNLTAELDRESQLAELRQQLNEAHKAVRDGTRGFKEELSEDVIAVRDSVRETEQEIRRIAADPAAPAAAPESPAPAALPETGDKPAPRP